jgi:peroxiredoxin
MAVTPSTMIPLGEKAPSFTLPDPRTGRDVSSEEFKGKPLLVMFICNHCPFVIHVADELARLGVDYREKGLGIVAISSNDVTTHPDDAPDKMAQMAEEKGFNFPYVYDESQEVARAFSAACTPDFFLYDADHRLAYRGQLDDSRPKTDEPVTGRDLRAAIDAVLRGEQPSDDQKPSAGCNIKWKG